MCRIWSTWYTWHDLIIESVQAVGPYIGCIQKIHISVDYEASSVQTRCANISTIANAGLANIEKNTINTLNLQSICLIAVYLGLCFMDGRVHNEKKGIWL